MAELTERRKADREQMALQVAELAGAYGLTAVPHPELPGTREASVDVSGPLGLKLTVRFDGGKRHPDTYVLSWHGVEDGVRLHWGMFGNVNPVHSHKATDVARGFAQLKRTLAERFMVIADGRAFIRDEVSP